MSDRTAAAVVAAAKAWMMFVAGEICDGACEMDLADKCVSDMLALYEATAKRLAVVEAERKAADAALARVRAVRANLVTKPKSGVCSGIYVELGEQLDAALAAQEPT